jgi:hypothetical protein
MDNKTSTPLIGEWKRTNPDKSIYRIFVPGGTYVGKVAPSWLGSGWDGEVALFRPPYPQPHRFIYVVYNAAAMGEAQSEVEDVIARLLGGETYEQICSQIENNQEAPGG